MKDRTNKDVNVGDRVCVLAGGAAGRFGFVEQIRSEPRRSEIGSVVSTVETARVKGAEDPEYPFECWCRATELAVVREPSVWRACCTGAQPASPAAATARPPAALKLEKPGFVGSAWHPVKGLELRDKRVGLEGKWVRLINVGNALLAQLASGPRSIEQLRAAVWGGRVADSGVYGALAKVRAKIAELGLVIEPVGGMFVLKKGGG